MRPLASIVPPLLLWCAAGCGDSGPPPAVVTISLGTVDASGSGFYPLSGDQELHVGFVDDPADLVPLGTSTSSTCPPIRSTALKRLTDPRGRI